MLGGCAESNTTKLTLKVVPTGADTFTQPLKPLRWNSCPGHPLSRQPGGGQESTLAVRLPSSGSLATAPGSHRLSAFGTWNPHPDPMSGGEREGTQSGHHSQKGREYTRSGHHSQKGRENIP
eukprot:3176087-Pyramimonas_sp.AAC.1